MQTHRDTQSWLLIFISLEHITLSSVLQATHRFCISAAPATSQIGSSQSYISQQDQPKSLALIPDIRKHERHPGCYVPFWQTV